MTIIIYIPEGETQVHHYTEGCVFRDAAELVATNRWACATTSVLVIE
jgi:hypothetical protein